MDLQLNNKTVAISGASKGIGFAIAQAFAREGCNLILCARDQVALQGAAEKIASGHGVDVKVIVADLASAEGITTLAENISDVDILVNNAGAIPGGNLQNVELEDWRAAWDLKVFGYISLTKALYDRLQKNGGVVINIIGVAGEYMLPEYIVGSSGNAALMAFTRSLGKQASKTGVRVVGINPGPVATERWDKLVSDIAATDPRKAEDMVKNMPLGRPAKPEEIANAVVFLASPLSAYTNATVLTIDGGPA